jgi:hypothetical protein
VNRSRRDAVPTFIGHVIGGSFGVAFVLANVSSLPPMPAVLLRVLAIATFAVVVVAFYSTAREWRTAGRAQPVGFTGFYWLVVVIEVIALLGGLAILRQLEPAAALGWTALVVGMHFFPLARLWPEGRSQLRAIAGSMTVLGVLGLVLAFTVHDAAAVAVVSGVGSGAVLLGWSLRQAIGSLRGR